MPHREFLGWDRPGLELAAEWLTAAHGAAMGDLIVALPGGRAGRRLLELLVERADPAAGVFLPPKIVTVGRLLDELVHTETPFAGRLARTLTWAQALSEQPAKALKRLMSNPPEPDDLSAWLALSEDVRSLHGELAGEGIDFDTVRAAVAPHAGAAEAARWQTLAGVQQRYRDRLSGLGLADPHDARRAALDAGALEQTSRVVVIGAAEMSRLQRALLDQLGERATALVLAPEILGETFDEYGCVRTGFWKDRALPLDIGQWSVVDEPRDQAACAAGMLSAWGERFAGEQISVGVPDASVTPYLERMLVADDVPVRDAAGLELSTLGPWRLLEAVTELLGSRRFAALAALVRHPDLATWLPESLDDKGRTPVECVDDYAQDHLPDRVPRRWPKREDAAPMRALAGRLDVLLGELGLDERRALPQWVDPILALLGQVYGERELDPGRNEDDRVLHAALVALRKALDEMAALGGEGQELAAPLALHLLLDTVARASVPPPPPAPLPAAQPVELLGWAELALDDAPALVLTGFNEGHVPEPVRAGAFLPDRLRRDLSLPDAEQRQARDAYTLALILSSGRQVELISGRRRVEGDPLRPSRLAFHCPDEQIVERGERRAVVGADRAGSDADIHARDGVPPLPRLAAAVLPGAGAGTGWRGRRTARAGPAALRQPRARRAAGLRQLGSEAQRGRGRRVRPAR